jgi:hypothetical protein
VEKLLSTRPWELVLQQQTLEPIRTLGGELVNTFFVLKDDSGNEVLMSRADVERFAPAVLGECGDRAGSEAGLVHAGAVRSGQAAALVGTLQPGPLETFVGNSRRIVHDDWDLRHLGKDYFEDLFSLCRGTATWPIRYVWTGRKGMKYALKRQGQPVNPNWMIETEGGERRTKQGGFLAHHAYNERHMFRWSYGQICEIFELPLGGVAS